MKLAACVLVLSAGVWSAAPADEPPSPAAQPPAVQPPAVQPPAVQPPAVQPPAAQPPAAQPPAAQAPATQAPPSGTSAKPAPGTAADVAATDAEIKQMRGRGYKPVNRNGTLVFCRDEGEIGTHFQRTRCSTLKQLKDAELTGKEYVNSIQQQGSAVPFKGP